jgi:hypothetical protein
MSWQLRPCRRDDLVAIVPQLTYWRVRDGGETGDLRTAGELADIEQYDCFNCGRSFEPEDPRGRPRDWDRAWQGALEHLPKPEASETSTMCGCFPFVSRSVSLKGGAK